MQRLCWITVVLLSFMAFAGAGQVDSHVIHFPSDWSMGMLYILDSNRVDSSSFFDWELFCEAIGKVNVVYFSVACSVDQSSLCLNVYGLLLQGGF